MYLPVFMPLMPAAIAISPARVSVAENGDDIHEVALQELKRPEGMEAIEAKEQGYKKVARFRIFPGATMKCAMLKGN